MTTNDVRRRYNWNPKPMHLHDAKGGKEWCERVTIGFGFTSDWLSKWRAFFKPIVCRSNAKQNQMRVTFEIQEKTLYQFVMKQTGDEK